VRVFGCLKPTSVMKVKAGLLAEVGTVRGTIDRSDPSGEDLSKSISVGTRKMVIYA
jgi:hypothetical protein